MSMGKKTVYEFKRLNIKYINGSSSMGIKKLNYENLSRILYYVKIMRVSQKSKHPLFYAFFYIRDEFRKVDSTFQTISFL
jgi:hypothetical protein